MKDIPITFYLNEKKYSGSFSAIHGGGSNLCHLMDDNNFYLGRLRLVNDRWVFDATPETQELTNLADLW